MNRNKNFSLAELFTGICLIAIIIAIFIPAFLRAQPYGTNTAGYGAHQFNDAMISPLQPSRTLVEQISRGINSGSCVVTTDGTITNTFSTNYTYSAPPVVIVTQRGAALNTSTNIVVSVTTTNFVLRSGLSSVTNNWIAIGQ